MSATKGELPLVTIHWALLMFCTNSVTIETFAQADLISALTLGYCLRAESYVLFLSQMSIRPNISVGFAAETDRETKTNDLVGRTNNCPRNKPVNCLKQTFINSVGNLVNWLESRYNKILMNSTVENYRQFCCVIIIMEALFPLSYCSIIVAAVAAAWPFGQLLKPG